MQCSRTWLNQRVECAQADNHTPASIQQLADRGMLRICSSSSIDSCPAGTFSRQVCLSTGQGEVGTLCYCSLSFSHLSKFYIPTGVPMGRIGQSPLVTNTPNRHSPRPPVEILPSQPDQLACKPHKASSRNCCTLGRSMHRMRVRHTMHPVQPLHLLAW